MNLDFIMSMKFLIFVNFASKIPPFIRKMRLFSRPAVDAATVDDDGGDDDDGAFGDSLQCYFSDEQN